MSNTQNGWLKFINSSTSTTSPTLLTIAGELRNRIYELVLLGDEKVYPFDYKPCSCNCPKHDRQAPSISLLRVNKQINSEATAILYSSVTFHLTTGYVLMKFMALGEVCMYGAPDSKQVFPSRHLIRSLHLKILPEYIPSEVHSGRMLECWADPHFQHITKKQRAQIIHQYHREVSQAVWRNACKVITQMMGLNVLSLDVEQAFCPNGCCRMVGDVLKSLHILGKREDFKVKVKGELNHEEKVMLLKGLGASNDIVSEGKAKTTLQEDDEDDMSMSEDYSEMEVDEDEDEDADGTTSEEDEEYGDSESDDDIMAAMMHAAVQASTPRLNGPSRTVGSSPSTVNLSVSTIEYAPQ